ncbi:ankyrin-2b isoform X1 [Siphateles boraxobius]|uniref:ankyrin-2b isoform X1 n=1 Tax=Siphateles boraxobius TaxID=180520 RepID=UPI0040640009
MSPESAMLLEDIRGSSPQSKGSINEFRSLSPDSPTPQYFQAGFESISVIDYMSSSPESALSEEEWELNVFTQDFFAESTESINVERSDSRSLSPDSPIHQYYTNQFEPTTVTGYISLSPESILSEIDMQTDVFDDLVIDFRRSSSDSITSINENRCLSTDSPIPDFTPATHTFIMPFTGSRPTSPESVSLEVENEFCPSDLNPEQRSDSPQSILSETEIRPLSPDSPVPQFSALFIQSALPVTRSRSCSPQSLCSENTDDDSYLEELSTIEYRPDSPDSILSDTDKRQLSPDSLSEWRPMSPESAMLLEDIRGSSPQSKGSINEFRSLSPDSPTPQYFRAGFESISVTDYMSSSPESTLSEEEWELNVFTQDFFAESTESINEERSDSRSLSPDSPIYQYYTSQFEPTIVTGYISLSPELILSEIDMQTDVFDDLVIDRRSSSSESITSINENRHLSPDSPIPDFTPATHTFIMPFNVSRPTSPESVSLEVENEFCPSDLNPEQRSDSPQSILSETEIRPLSPDSPVPQFSALFIQSTLPVTRSRSWSPQSLCSENTDDDSYLEELSTIEYRPDSPDSILSDTDKRQLSPDSLSEWRPMSPESAMLLEDIRGSSPQSKGSINEFRSLSPDSPTPQYFQAGFESISVIDYMSSSPESALSEEEWELNVFTQDFFAESTESINVERSDSRSLSPDSPIHQYYTNQFEPTTVTGYISLSPESILSEIDMQTDVFDDLVIDFRRSSSDSITSINENRCLSTDSPIPDFTPATHTFIMPFTGSRPTSPESVSLEVENEFCPSDLNPEQRSDSPQSILSETEIRPLSPDSPVPQFSALFIQSALPVTRSRSCSPQSLCSENTDDDSYLEELSTIEYRPDSPDSILSDTDKRQLSPDSLSEWRPMSPESAMLLEDIRGSSPQSKGSINEFRSLSPDSPTPQYFRAGFESISVTDYMSSSPESTLSEEEWELNVFTQDFFAESTESINEERSDSRSLSPDSPIYQYYTSQFEPTIVTGYISLSPELILSEIDMQTDVFDDLVIDRRSSSSESITSINENRHLSPDSPIPDFTPATHTFIMPFNVSRPTSPESVSLEVENEFCPSDLNPEQRSDSPQSILSETEIRPLSPDSPVPQFSALFIQSTLPVTRSRSCSPQSLCSENTDDDSYLEELSTIEYRPDSPDSILSDTDKRQLSPDSLSEWRPMSPESAMLLEDIRGSSPQSKGSINEFRSLSPDSPTPQYFRAGFESISVTDYMSSSPESALSEEEWELNIFTQDCFAESTESINEERSDSRSLSPDSPIHQYYTNQFDPTTVTGYISLSPESILSEIDMQTDVFDDMVIDFRRSSSDSITSINENRCLSTDSPIPDFTPATHTFIMPFTGSRPTSPESVSLEVENEFCPSDLNPEQRSDSPQSILSETEIRPLSPDSPVPQFSALFIQSTLPVTRSRSCSPQSLCSENTDDDSYLEELSTIEYRPDSPDSILSDTDKRQLSPDSLSEWRPMSPESAMLLEEIRGSSPQSNGSINEFRPLSPDSPTPQYVRAGFESISVTNYMSSSPESALSEEEWELNVFTQDCFAESTESINEERSDSRSLSPDFPIYQYYTNQFEPTIVTGYISLSPESILSEIDMQTDVFDDLLIDLRRSSSESITSINANRPLSPDSPIPDFTPATHTFIMPFTGSRPSSPESVSLDLENDFCHSDLNPEQRSDSPQSILSETEIRALSPDSPVPQFSALFAQRTLSVTGSRSCSPQSLCSESTEYKSYFEDLFTTGSILSEFDRSTDIFNDFRLPSPDSLTSVNESRPLSPDSPVPDFTPLTFTFIIPESDSQSTSPVSLDVENEFYQSDLSTEYRPDSPESVISEIDHRPLSPDSVSDYRPMTPMSMVDRASPESFISLEECRPLPPDSPVPQFSCIHKISAMNLYRSVSSESLSSDTDIELWVFAPQNTEQRTSSPESIMSLNEKRPLSPDSPVYDFKPSVYVNVTQKATYRSSSLESIVSDVEFDTASFASEGNTWTEYRPLSPESGKISPVDQCHLEIEYNQTVDQKHQSLGQEVSNSMTYLSLQTTVRMEPQYKLVYKAAPLSLISHLYDPQYRGETFCSKPGVFEYAGCKKEIFKTFECSSETPVHAESSDLFGENQALSTDSLFYCASLYPFLMDNSDRRASSPESYTSMNEYRRLSPDSPVPEHRLSLPSAEFLAESRSSSPETTFSLNEFRSLSPDSPIPEYSTPSPVPNELFQSSVALNQHKSIFTPLSPSLCNDQSSDIGSVFPESFSSWYPLPQWIMSENRPLSSISDISDTDSRSLSPQMFCHETELRNPSPEAATLETELTETVTPEPLVFEEIYQPESPESVIESEYEEFYENLNYLSFSDIDEITKDLSVLKDGSALLNLVTFEQCTTQVKSPPETEGLQTVECSFDEELKPTPSLDIALEQAQKDTESVTKTISYCEERDVITTTGASAKDETSKGLIIHTREDNQHMESLQQQKDDLGDDSRKLAPQDAKIGENVSMDIHSEPQVKDLSSISKSLEPQIKSTASLLTSESSKESHLTTCVHNIPEQNRSQPVFDLEAHKSTPHSSPKEPKASNVLQEVNYFQFYLKDSHRRVELNQIDSSGFHLSLESPDYKTLLSRSVKTSSTGIQMSLTDLSSISPIISTSSSDQRNSPESHESLSERISCAEEVVQFEQTLPSFGGDEPESSLALPGTYPLTPCNLEVTKELKASEMPIKLTGDQMQLDATAALDVDSPLYSLNLNYRPRPVHADSIESDTEFFDCQQTFSDTSEPEVGSSELLDVSQAIYQVEELPSLSSSPEYLTGIPKLREYTQLKKDDRPLSWGSEDLPIVLEPDDEYTGEAGEEKAFPYDYTGDHSFAEELPPMKGIECDDDDDFLGREIAEELGLLSDSSEEEVLTTRVVRRRVIIQGDEMPEIPPQTVTEEQYTDEYGNMVVKKITRKVIRKYVSADGVEREEVMSEGPRQEVVAVDEADGFSKVVKRTVVKSGGDQTEVTFSEPFSYTGATASEFEDEPVQGRKVSKVVKTMVVQGERMEKLIGDPSLSSDLPSAKDDFEKALSYVGSFGKVHLPHLAESETVKEDGSVVRRTRMHKTRTQKRTVVKDGQTKQTHLERLEDTQDAPRPHDLQRPHDLLRPHDLQEHLHRLLQRYCTPEPEPDAGEQDTQ